MRIVLAARVAIAACAVAFGSPRVTAAVRRLGL